MFVDNVSEPLIGRDFEYNFMKQALKKYQNISIVGDIKIGKTSLLKSLEQELLNEKDFSNFIPIYIDFKKLTYDFSVKNDLNVDMLIGKILNQIYDLNCEIKDKYINSILGPRHDFSSVVDYCSRKKLILTLMLDKFDMVTILRNLDDQFFLYLRGLAYERGLSIITASRSKLETLCHKGDIAGSHFWNIFNPIITLSLFNDSESSNELLKMGIINDNIRNLIIQSVGNHPCYLKVAANIVIQNRFTESDDENIIRDAIYEELLPYYSKCIDLLKKDERNVDDGIHYKMDYMSTLYSVCNHEIEEYERKKRELRSLEQFGYLIREKNNYKIYSPLFEKFVIESSRIKPEAYKGFEEYIFVSYSHADSDEIMEEILKLQNHNHKVWYDDGIEGKWRKDIAEKIKGASVFITFISQNSVKSDYVIKEIEFAIKNNKSIVPVYLNETTLPDELGFELDEIQAIFKYKENNEYFKRLLSRIKNNI